MKITEEDVATISDARLYIEQLQKENEVLRRLLEGTKKQLNATKLHLEHVLNDTNKTY